MYYCYLLLKCLLILLIISARAWKHIYLSYYHFHLTFGSFCSLNIFWKKNFVKLARNAASSNRSRLSQSCAPSTLPPFSSEMLIDTRAVSYKNKPRFLKKYALRTSRKSGFNTRCVFVCPQNRDSIHATYVLWEMKLIALARNVRRSISMISAIAVTFTFPMRSFPWTTSTYRIERVLVMQNKHQTQKCPTRITAPKYLLTLNVFQNTIIKRSKSEFPSSSSAPTVFTVLLISCWPSMIFVWFLTLQFSVGVEW